MMSSINTVPVSTTISDDFPELAGYSLGSLKKYARGRNLKAARIALILACVLMSLQATLIFMFIDRNVSQFESRVRQEVKKKGFFASVNEQKLSEIKVVLRRVYEVFSIGMFGFVAAFLVLGLLVYRFPLFSTVGGLILYMGFHLIMAYLISREHGVVDVMEFLLSWWPAKIVIILGLVKGIHTAVMYQRDRAELSAQEWVQASAGA